jgi:hypothetical protein
MKTTSFAPELAGLSHELAAELEDHLMACFEAGLQSGLSIDQARAAALRSLGVPTEIARRCDMESRRRWARRAPLTLPQRLAILGWLLLGVGFASRVCLASDPSAGSIAACLGLSAGSLTLALLLRRGWVSPWFGTSASLGLALLAGFWFLKTSWHPWIQDSFALSPVALAGLVLFGLLSLAAATSVPRLQAAS